jgi:hypothetical protein
MAAPQKLEVVHKKAALNVLAFDGLMSADELGQKLGVVSQTAAALAIATAKESLRQVVKRRVTENKPVVWKDDQDFSLVLAGVGAAKFNSSATASTAQADITKLLNDHVVEKNRRRTPVQLTNGRVPLRTLFETALDATNGVVAHAMGSIAEVLCDKANEGKNRDRLSSQIERLPVCFKDYYLFAGLFVGTQDDRDLADLGRVGANLNIALNPLSCAMTGAYQGAVDSKKHWVPFVPADLVITAMMMRYEGMKQAWASLSDPKIVDKFILFQGQPPRPRDHFKPGTF